MSDQDHAQRKGQVQQGCTSLGISKGNGNGNVKDYDMCEGQGGCKGGHEATCEDVLERVSVGQDAATTCSKQTGISMSSSHTFYPHAIEEKYGSNPTGNGPYTTKVIKTSNYAEMITQTEDPSGSRATASDQDIVGDAQWSENCSGDRSECAEQGRSAPISSSEVTLHVDQVGDSLMRSASTFQTMDVYNRGGHDTSLEKVSLSQDTDAACSRLGELSSAHAFPPHTNEGKCGLTSECHIGSRPCTTEAIKRSTYAEILAQGIDPGGSRGTISNRDIVGDVQVAKTCVGDDGERSEQDNSAPGTIRKMLGSLLTSATNTFKHLSPGMGPTAAAVPAMASGNTEVMDCKEFVVMASHFKCANKKDADEKMNFLADLLRENQRLRSLAMASALFGNKNLDRNVDVAKFLSVVRLCLGDRAAMECDDVKEVCSNEVKSSTKADSPRLASVMVAGCVNHPPEKQSEVQNDLGREGQDLEHCLRTVEVTMPVAPLNSTSETQGELQKEGECKGRQDSGPLPSRTSVTETMKIPPSSRQGIKGQKGDMEQHVLNSLPMVAQTLLPEALPDRSIIDEHAREGDVERAGGVSVKGSSVLRKPANSHLDGAEDQLSSSGDCPRQEEGVLKVPESMEPMQSLTICEDRNEQHNSQYIVEMQDHKESEKDYQVTEDCAEDGGVNPSVNRGEMCHHEEQFTQAANQLISVASEWINRLWGYTISEYDRREYSPWDNMGGWVASAKNKGKSGKEEDPASVLECLCDAVSALLGMPILSSTKSSTALLNQVRQSWPLIYGCQGLTREPLVVLERVCRVLERCHKRVMIGDTALAPQLGMLLTEHCVQAVRWAAGQPEGKVEQVMRIINTHLSPVNVLCQDMVCALAVASLKIYSSRTGERGLGIDGVEDVAGGGNMCPSLDEVLLNWKLWILLIRWNEFVAPPDRAESGNNLNDIVQGIFDDIKQVVDSIMSGDIELDELLKFQEHSHKKAFINVLDAFLWPGGSISSWINKEKSNRMSRKFLYEGNNVRQAIVCKRLTELLNAAEAFPNVLKGVDILASMYCPAAGVDGSLLKSALAVLQQDFLDGFLEAKNLNQVVVLAPVLSFNKVMAQSVPLDVLLLLSESQIFINVWADQGDQVLKNISDILTPGAEGEMRVMEDVEQFLLGLDKNRGNLRGEGDTSVSMATTVGSFEGVEEDSQGHSQGLESSDKSQSEVIVKGAGDGDERVVKNRLAEKSVISIETVVRYVIPRALVAWRYLVYRISEGDIFAREASLLVGGMTDLQREMEVQLLVKFIPEHHLPFWNNKGGPLGDVSASCPFYSASPPHPNPPFTPHTKNEKSCCSLHSISPLSPTVLAKLAHPLMQPSDFHHTAQDSLSGGLQSASFSGQLPLRISQPPTQPNWHPLSHELQEVEVTGILAAFDAYASLEWFLTVAPTLLTAHAVFRYSPSAHDNTSEKHENEGGQGDDKRGNNTSSDLDGEIGVVKGRGNGHDPFLFSVLPSRDSSHLKLQGIFSSVREKWNILTLREAHEAWNDIDEWGGGSRYEGDDSRAEDKGGVKDGELEVGNGNHDSGSSLKKSKGRKGKRNNRFVKSGTKTDMGLAKVCLQEGVSGQQVPRQWRRNVDVLVKLLETPPLVHWLLDHPSNDEFSRLLQVCRPCTDEPGLLSSLASLVEIRSRFLPVSAQGPYPSLQLLVRAFSSIDVGLKEHFKAGAKEDVEEGGKEESFLWHLENTMARFGRLKELFENQTVSAGVKALRNLREILSRGIFVLHAGSRYSTHDGTAFDRNGGRSFSLVLELNTHTPIMTTEVSSKAVPDGVGSGTEAMATVVVQDEQHLLGLRARLSFMEIPEEQETTWIESCGHGARVAVESFKGQLQVLSDMVETLERLREAGHPLYQEGWKMRQMFELGGETSLSHLWQSLQKEEQDWAALVQEARDRWHLLNFFTMQDILHLHKILTLHSWRSSTSLHSPKSNTICSILEEETQGGATQHFRMEKSEALAKVHATLHLLSSDVRLEMAFQFLARWEEKLVTGQGILDSLGSALEDSVAAEDEVGRGKTVRRISLPAQRVANRFDVLVTTVGSGSSGASRSDGVGICLSETEEPESVVIGETGGRQSLFATCAESADGVIRLVLSVYVRRGRLPQPSEVLFCTDETTDEELELLVRRYVQARPLQQGNNSGLKKVGREVEVDVRKEEGKEPGKHLEDRGLEEDLIAERAVPVFTIADIHRLSFTSQANLMRHLRSKVLLYRQRNKYTNFDGVVNSGHFMGMANGSHQSVHTCMTSAEAGPEGILLIVSGEPKQALLSWLSGHVVELPSLTSEVLKETVASALNTHFEGPTLVVRSEVNGGGKTHHIMKTIVKEQQIREEKRLLQGEEESKARENEVQELGWAEESKGQGASSSVNHSGGDVEPLYVRVPVGSAFTREDLCRRVVIKHAVSQGLTGNSQGQGIMHGRDGDLAADSRGLGRGLVAFHLDLGLVPPKDCNTLLFQLLLGGCIRDPVTCEVFVRWKGDSFYVEIPNSEGDRTARTLHICSLLPCIMLQVLPSKMDLYTPILQGQKLLMLPDISIQRTCRWLRAAERGYLLPDSTGPDPSAGDANGKGLSHDIVPQEECFELLRQCCCLAGGPSETPTWTLFNRFVSLTSHLLARVEMYPLLGPAVARRGVYEHGLETFRDVFLRLLIECCKDFALRSVPQLRSVMVNPLGNMEGGPPLEGDDLKANESNGNPVAFVKAPINMEESRCLARRFQTMIGWEKSDHPIVVFKADTPSGQFGEVSGVDILSLNRHPRLADAYIQEPLKSALQINGIDLARNWELITAEEAVELLKSMGGVLRACGSVASTLSMDDVLGDDYVFTVDNLLKMLSITLRLQANMPVVIMGDTGCGKSRLVSCMCSILDWPLAVLNVHSGLSYTDIVHWVEEQASLARAAEAAGRAGITVIHLDEINTCNSVSLFKEIVCDGSVDGKPLPQSLRIVAACNPYRLRASKKKIASTEGVRRGPKRNDQLVVNGRGLGRMMGAEKSDLNVKDLVIDASGMEDIDGNVVGLSTGVTDPIKDLVYRVHPLHESLVDHVMDYGALKRCTERQYIVAMVNKGLGDGNGRVRSPISGLLEVFSEVLCTAQETLRTLFGGERATVSLRDVSRCIKVFVWLGKEWVIHGSNSLIASSAQLRTLPGFFNCEDKESKMAAMEAMVLSLAYSYLARLPRPDRNVLVRDVCRTASVCGSRYGLKMDATWFASTVRKSAQKTAESMILGPGVAANEALSENLFVLLVSIVNSIPVFVVGKPGSSKSLAISVIIENLRGQASVNTFLRSLPAVEVFFHQCSPMSTSHGILQTFKQARDYHRSAPNTVVVVLLDEVGLAEQSPHLPLKVLHKILDEAQHGETVVGISNWALDSAKMNRAVHIHRPPPTVKDLTLTAQGMSSVSVGGSENSIGRSWNWNRWVEARNVRQTLNGLARAYAGVYEQQRHADFWGLREFYSTVRGVDHYLRNHVMSEVNKGRDFNSYIRGVENGHIDIPPAVLVRVVLRNFGGRPQSETFEVLNVFFSELLQQSPPPVYTLPTVDELIRDNLAEKKARHLMLLTKNNAALSLLFDMKLLDHSTTEVLFGSDFPGDRTDMQVCLDIQTVKACMARGGTVVLVHCECMYESLYDLLNQHYTECAGRLYVRLAMGAHSQLCPLDPKFRVVVVVESIEAYEKLAPPLLNRFEKQILGWREVLDLFQPSELYTQLMNQTRDFAMDLASGQGGQTDSARWGEMRKAFPGYAKDFLPSLVLAVVELAGCSGRSFQCRSRNHAPSQSDEGVEESKGSNELFATRDSDDRSRGGGGAGDGWCNVDHAELTVKDLFEACLEKLLWVATPEAVCQLIRHARNPSTSRQSHHTKLEEAADKYFQHQTHGSLEDFARVTLPAWGGQGMSSAVVAGRTQSELGSVGGCVVVTTYAPLEGDAAARDLCCPGGGAWNVHHVVMHELSQERDLKKRVRDFFSPESAKDGDVLLLQFDLQVSPVRMVEHAKFIVEDARAALVQSRQDSSITIKGAGRGIHVILLLHLIRDDDAFRMSFDTRWGAAFVDSVGDGVGGNGGGLGSLGIVGQDGVPNAVEAVGKSMQDVVTGLDPVKVLLSTMRASLARLDFCEGRFHSVNLVREQICLLQDACSNNGGSSSTAAKVHAVPSEFVMATWKAVIYSVSNGKQGYATEGVRKIEDGPGAGMEDKDKTAVSEKKEEVKCQEGQGQGGGLGGRGEKVDVAYAASSDRQLRLAGTFQRAIRALVLGSVTRGFSMVLSHMDRNSGLSLLKEEGLRELWIDLFQASFHSMGFLPLAVQPSWPRLHSPVAAPATSSYSTGSLILRGAERFAVLDTTLSPGDPSLHCKFPFSFFLFRLLEDLRRNRGGVAGAGGEGSYTHADVTDKGNHSCSESENILNDSSMDKEEALRSEFALLGLCDRIHGDLRNPSTFRSSALDHCDDRPLSQAGSLGISTALSMRWSEGESLLERYVYDFTCMMLPSVRDMTRSHQASLLLLLLDLEGCTEVLPVRQQGMALGATSPQTSTLAAVHHRFWQVEQSARLYFKLLDAAGPPSFSPVTIVLKTRLQEMLAGEAKHSCPAVDGSLHLKVACVVVNALMDFNAQGITKVTVCGEGREKMDMGEGVDCGKWLRWVDAADFATQTLLNLVHSLSSSTTATCEHGCEMGTCDVTKEQMEGDGRGGNGSGTEGNPGIDKDGMVEQCLNSLQEGWLRLRLMRDLVRDMATPLHLSPADTLEALHVLRTSPGPVLSAVFFKEIILLLAVVARKMGLADETTVSSTEDIRAGGTPITTFLESNLLGGLTLGQSDNGNDRDLSSTSSAIFADPEDVLPQYLEGYLFNVVTCCGGETVTAYSASRRSGECGCNRATIGGVSCQGSRRVEGAGLGTSTSPTLPWKSSTCSSMGDLSSVLIMTLAGDCRSLLENLLAHGGASGGGHEMSISSKHLEIVMPRDSACIRVLSWVRGVESTDLHRELRSALLKEFRETGDLRHTQLTFRFVAAAEDGMELDEASLKGDDSARAFAPDRSGTMDTPGIATHQPRVSTQAKEHRSEDSMSLRLEKEFLAIACMRKVACAAAEFLLRTSQRGGNLSQVDQRKAARLLDVLTSALELHNATVTSEKDEKEVEGSEMKNTAHLRMFLLRQLALRPEGGIEVLRNALRCTPLIQYRWVVHDDPRIAAFVGSSRLPQINPLERVPFFHDCRMALRRYMTSGDLQKLEARLMEVASPARINGLGAFKGGLLTGLFYEMNLMQVNSEFSEAKGHLQLHDLGERAEILAFWLYDSASLSFLSRVERCLLVVFSGIKVGDESSRDAGDKRNGIGRSRAFGWSGATTDGSQGKKSADESRDAAEAMQAREKLRLGRDSSLLQIVMARLAVHVVAAALAAHPSSPLKFFEQLVTSPAALRGAYLPTMEESLDLQQVRDVGRPYQCACGEIYTVGACGKPMERRNCSCGRILGGIDHVVDQPNSFNVTPINVEGYCLRFPCEGRIPTRIRGMSSVQVATTRLVLHLAGTVGAAAGGHGWAAEARSILNNSFITIQPTGPGVIRMFSSRVDEDREALCKLTGWNVEDAMLAVHLSLLSGLDPRGQGTMEPINLVDGSLNLKGETERTKWEGNFCDMYLHVTTGEKKNVKRKIDCAAQELRKGGDEATLVAELLAKTDVIEDKGVREDLGLWDLWQTFSMKRFKDAFLHLDQRERTKMPLLKMMTEDDQQPARGALRHLPAALQWVHLLKWRFEGKIDRQQARSWTAHTALERAKGAGDQRTWQAAFKGFCQFWKCGQILVNRWECQEIPKHYRQESVGEDTRLSFLLPSKLDEGIFPLALLTHLVRQHNELVQAGRSNPGLGGQNENEEEVQTLHMTGAHAIDFDVEDRLSPMLESQCCEKTGHHISFNFVKAESHVVKVILSGIPIVRLDEDAIQFSYRGDEGGGEALLTKLGLKVCQEPLPQCEKVAISRDLSTPARAQSLLEVLDSAISILASVGGNLVQTLSEETANILLSDFMWDVMRVESSCGNDNHGGKGKGLPPTVARYTRLKHLHDLWDLALARTAQEWTSGICKRFCDKLPDRAAVQIRQAADEMELDVLLPLFKQYIRNYLRDGSPISTKSTVKENLEWMQTGDNYLRDIPWFSKNWPRDVQMRYALSIFQLLEKRQPIM